MTAALAGNVLLGALCLAALLLIALGAIALARANKVFQTSASRVETAARRISGNVEGVRRAMDRLKRASAGLEELRERAARAANQIREGLASMRVPEAIAVFRLGILAARIVARLR